MAENSGSRYVEISVKEMGQTLEAAGFKRQDEKGCWEMIWVRPVETKGVKFPYAIKVYSTIDIRTKVSRKCGADAIRLCLMDSVTGRPIKAAEKKVLRTMNALPNTLERARDLFRFVIASPKCQKCGAILVERGQEGKRFMGCSHFNPNETWNCTFTQKIVERN